MTTYRYVRFRLFSIAVLLGAVAHAESPAQAPSEYQVKALFLYNFVKFVEWPASSEVQGAPYTLCVLGKDPFEGQLERAVEGKIFNGHPLATRRINDTREAYSCQILFISASEVGRGSEIVRILANWSVLTVGDSDKLWGQGVMINLLMDGQKVHFRVNQDAAERAFLKISSKLLQLGTASLEKKNK